MQQAQYTCFSATTLRNIFESSRKRAISKIRPLWHAECIYQKAYGGRRWPALVIVGHSVADDSSSATLFFFARMTDDCVDDGCPLFTSPCCHLRDRLKYSVEIQAASVSDGMASFNMLSSAGHTRSGVNSLMHLRCGHVRR